MSSGVLWLYVKLKFTGWFTGCYCPMKNDKVDNHRWVFRKKSTPSWMQLKSETDYPII